MKRLRGRLTIELALSISGGVVIGLLMSCSSTPDRRPVPRDLSASASIPDLPLARFWADEAPPFTEDWMGLSDDYIADRYAGIYAKEHHYLAVSGGGPNGAFGAGLLVGWTRSGKRPEFTMVTGISTGALIAPFAFLGPSYDDELKEAYTTYSTEDFLEKRSLLGTLTSDAATDTTPLAQLIARYVDEEMMEEIAREFHRGRKLLIGTTNLDAERPVIWSLGYIAASGRPEALQLIRKILLASASIPVAFPPVYFDVAADGESYDEMHVDGGATSQVFLYPGGLAWSDVTRRLRVKGAPKAWVIRNAQLRPSYKAVQPKLMDIAMHSIQSLLKTQGIGDLYRIYAKAKRDGLEFRVVDIPSDVDLEDKSEFMDPVFMKRLFDRGFEMGVRQEAWSDIPPGFQRAFFKVEP